MFLTFLGLLLSTGHAMTVPEGWSAVGENRVVLNPLDPSLGEVRMFVVGDGTGDVDELCLSLQWAGYEVRERSVDEGGAVNLRLGSGLGRAKFRRQEGAATWVVVLASVGASGSLDPDALIAATLPPPTNIMWGAGPQVLSGGMDGSPWGASDESESAGWVAEIEVEPWAQRPGLAGAWMGNLLILGVPTRLVFEFEATGLVTLERSARGDAATHQGSWATRKDRMRLDLPGGSPSLAYQLDSDSLWLEFEGRQLTLYRSDRADQTP